MESSEKVKILYSAIGEVDDRYAAEALRYMQRMRAENEMKKRRRSRALTAWLVAAAVLVSILTAVGAMSLAGRKMNEALNGFRPDASSGEKPEEQVNQKSEELNVLPSQLEACSFEGTLRAARKAEYVTENPDLFSGIPTVFWQYADSDTVYSKPLGELGGTLSMVDFDWCYPIAPEYSGAGWTRVWICDGAGCVVTPYLCASAGNIGYGELFDYTPEILPPSYYVGRFSRFFT